MKLTELPPTKGNLYKTFTEDTIGRSGDVIRFAKFLNDIDESLTVAINNSWGGGKTFFVKQVKMLIDVYNEHIKTDFSEHEVSTIKNCVKRYDDKNHEFQPQVCVYYDAWANDNDDDPILSLVYEIIQSAQSDFSFAKGTSIIEVASSIIDYFTGRSSTEIKKALHSENALDKIKSRKDMFSIVEDFLESLLPEHGNRLVVFIDELDRCKPDFAVQLLERIKHYFTNNRITFVFTINATALQHTIKRFYGEGFDATRYLDRFFDIVMPLPPLNNEKFLNSIGVYKNKELYNPQANHVYDLLRRDVIKHYNFQMREIIRYYKATSIVAPKESDIWANQGGQNALEYSLAFALPVAIALQQSDINRYNEYINGNDWSPLANLLLSGDYNNSLGIFLNDNETYDDPRNENEQKVSYKDKIHEFYEALFVKEYKDNYTYGYVIGNTRFSENTRKEFYRALCLYWQSVRKHE